jgi:hypothetical protein
MGNGEWFNYLGNGEGEGAWRLASPSRSLSLFPQLSLPRSQFPVPSSPEVVVDRVIGESFSQINT